MQLANFRTLVLVLAFLAAACSAPATNNSNQPEVAGVEEVARFEKYSPFPDATSVRLFAQSEPFEIETISRLSDARGRLLTKDESAFLATAFSRKTIIRSPAKGYLATSCAFVPRHLFRFYNERDERLGDALVCFECYEVELRPSGALESQTSPKTGQSILSVNYAILDKLMRRMKVPTYALP